MPFSSPHALNATQSQPTLPANRVETSTNNTPNGVVIGCLSIATALGIALLALGCKRYRARQRSRQLKQQIAMLEAMWRISSTK